MIAKVPQLVPVAKAMSAAATNVAGTSRTGHASPRTSSATNGPVPNLVHTSPRVIASNSISTRPSSDSIPLSPNRTSSSSEASRWASISAQAAMLPAITAQSALVEPEPWPSTPSPVM